MRFELFSVVILLASMFYGCVTSESHIGIYKLDKTPSDTLELREDGTYILVPADSRFTEKGVYVKRGSTIEVTGALGFTSVMTITEYGLLEDNGDRWIRIMDK